VQRINYDGNNNNNNNDNVIDHLIDMLIVVQLAKKFPTFHDAEGLVPSSQKSATETYPISVECSTCC
jgi:hypothetical protein